MITSTVHELLASFLLTLIMAETSWESIGPLLTSVQWVKKTSSGLPQANPEHGVMVLSELPDELRHEYGKWNIERASESKSALEKYTNDDGVFRQPWLYSSDPQVVPEWLRDREAGAKPNQAATIALLRKTEMHNEDEPGTCIPAKPRPVAGEIGSTTQSLQAVLLGIHQVAATAPICRVCERHLGVICPSCEDSGSIQCSLLSGSCGHRFHRGCFWDWQRNHRRVWGYASDPDCPAHEPCPAKHSYHDEYCLLDHHKIGDTLETKSSADVLIEDLILERQKAALNSSLAEQGTPAKLRETITKDCDWLYTLTEIREFYGPFQKPYYDYGRDGQSLVSSIVTYNSEPDDRLWPCCGESRNSEEVIFYEDAKMELILERLGSP